MARGQHPKLSGCRYSSPGPKQFIFCPSVFGMSSPIPVVLNPTSIIPTKPQPKANWRPFRCPINRCLLRSWDALCPRTWGFLKTQLHKLIGGLSENGTNQDVSRGSEGSRRLHENAGSSGGPIHDLLGSTLWKAVSGPSICVCDSGCGEQYWGLGFRKGYHTAVRTWGTLP